MDIKIEFIVPERELVTIQHNYTAQGLEKMTKDGVVYIRFDGLLFDLREYVFKNPLYEEGMIKEFQRECGCGKGYFVEENLFYKLIKGF
jgi:hypothetical protein